MPMFRPVDTTGNTLSMMIPLLMQKKRDQEELAYKDKVLEIKRQELQAEAQERSQKLKDEIFKTKVKSLQDLHKSAYEKGDAGLVKSTGRPLMELGFPVAAQELPSSELDMTGQPNLKWLTAPKESELTGTAKNLEAILGRKPTLQELKEYGENPPGLTGTAKNLEILLGRKPTLEELKQYGQDESKPYYTPVQTSTGFVRFNNRTGQIEPMAGTGGGPLLPVTADPSLAGAKKGAEKAAEVLEERKKSYPKVRDSYKSLSLQWDNVEKAIDRALDKVSPFTAGLGAWAASIPASPQKDLKETLETIKANIGFDKLQDMRANSPTGGALGQVSDFENKLLQAVQGSLDQKQSAGQLKQNLTTVKTMLQQLRAQKDFAFKYDFKDIIDEKGKASGPQAGDVEGGYKFKGGDPADSKNWEKVK